MIRRIIWNPDKSLWPRCKEIYETELGDLTFERKATPLDLIVAFWQWWIYLIVDMEEENV